MMNINISLSSNKYNTILVPSIYDLYYKNNRYVILNDNDKNIITKSNPIIGWMQNCLVCESYTFKLINIESNNNDNKIYFYVCSKCEEEFNSYNFIVKCLDENIFIKHHIDYEKINKNLPT